jgi:hypothetical protein
MEFIDIITKILLCLQSAFAGICAYGIRHKGTIPEEEIVKYYNLNWICFGLLLSIGLIGMLLF